MHATLVMTGIPAPSGGGGVKNWPLPRTLAQGKTNPQNATVAARALFELQKSAPDGAALAALMRQAADRLQIHRGQA